MSTSARAAVYKQLSSNCQNPASEMWAEIAKDIEAAYAEGHAAGVRQEREALKAFARKWWPFPMSYILSNWVANRKGNHGHTSDA